VQMTTSQRWFEVTPENGKKGGVIQRLRVKGTSWKDPECLKSKKGKLPSRGETGKHEGKEIPKTEKRLGTIT